VPFAAVDEHGRAPQQQQQQQHGGSKAQLLPQCDSCRAYINCVYDIEKWIWTCAVCGNLNGFSNDASARYQTSQAPELVSSFIDFEFDGANFLLSPPSPSPRCIVEFLQSFLFWFFLVKTSVPPDKTSFRCQECGLLHIDY
jgi:ribosomal protein L37AE/L43A